VSRSLLDRHAARPRRVLAVIELGRNWGHLLALRPVLRALKERGHVLHLATRDVEAARSLLAGDGIEIHACPEAGPAPNERGSRGPSELRHYVQLLDHVAFGDERELGQAQDRWAGLIERTRAEVLLANFAPGALLAARLHRLPVVQLATGWESPDPTAPLPDVQVRPRRDPGRETFSALEARLLERLNRRCVAAGVAPLETLAALYAEGVQLLATWPELDHFGPRRDARYLGPIYSLDHGARVAWPQGGAAAGPRVLLYLAADARNAVIVRALASIGADVVAILPGTPANEIARLRGPRARVVEGPAQLGPVLSGARLVITNGGHGVAAATLAAGVALAVLPHTGEQALTLRRLAERGLARPMIERGGVEDHARRLAAMLAEDRPSHAQRAVASKYAGASQFRSVLGVVDAVERVGA
jgi:UDP:flavonoid glycosyltransferase YjiC (YdhE family)